MLKHIAILTCSLNLHVFEVCVCHVAAQSKVWVCCHFLVEIAGLKPAGGMGICVWRVLCVVR